MSLMDKIKHELVDIIEFMDNSQNTIVHRFDRYQNEIKNGAKLIVREGQQAVFIDEGQIADVYQPGTYTLSTENMPLLTTIKGWKYGFNSPFKAEVYFVSTRNFLDQKWGTKTPITLNDDRFGMLEIRAFGTYTFKVTDAGKFIKEIVGTNSTFTTDDICEQLRSIIVTRMSDAAGEANLPIEKYASNLNDLSKNIFDLMKDDFEAYGVDITKFLVENVSMPDEVKKEIFELSRLDKIDLNKYTQYKAANAIETAAANPSGMGGMGAGMGAGFAIGNQMVNAMGQGMQNNQTQNVGAMPPPIPVINYYLAINGQQAGPYAVAALTEMAIAGTLTRETLVWKNGMSTWSKAGDQTELNEIWAQTPPPLPSL